MNSYVEAPEEWYGSVFLAGGITGCPDWQSEAAKLLPGATVFNPRRADFPIGDPTAGPDQIRWEFRHLDRADVILFWFPKGAIQPIALYELGRHAALGANIVVGADPEYERRLDVVVQISLACPHLNVYDSLEDVCAMVEWSLRNLE